MLTGTFPWTWNIIHDGHFPLHLLSCWFNSATEQRKWPWLHCLHTKPVDSLPCCYCFCSCQLVDPQHNFLSVSDDAHPTSLCCVAHLDNCEHMFIFGVCVCVSMHVHRLTFWTHNWPRKVLRSVMSSKLTLKPSEVSFELITVLETFRTLQWIHIYIHTHYVQNPVPSGRKASVHLTLEHAICPTCSKPMKSSGKNSISPNKISLKSPGRTDSSISHFAGNVSVK